MSKSIAIGGDHAGFEYKEAVKEALQNKGYEVKDFGPYSSESADYADFAHPLSSFVADGNADYGILICGSGNGVAMTANKHEGIRAALCWNDELAALARQHNDANILCMPARFVSLELAQSMVNTFDETEFEGGRHARRVGKINC